MRTFGLWLLQVSVPAAFAICLLILFPRLLESTLLAALSYCLGAFFVLMAAFITYSYLLSAIRQEAGPHTHLTGRRDVR